ncbi:hypothetical protein [Haloferax sulfurifontis]|uniref:Uncharacterized protein n=2 Tax=Haloferax sulfurifontis TaxID=255616 RepID=M0IKR5_9EURY|nr:hypothetical protein [Haloferax sulfurifontis]ELZ96627.1 hypothetical protein C441_04644 [Haloferax sulfurifontis ATCC BAA-897]GGC72362.1 hypothetical protein GCM10007209_37840 [Haloferax sulfurifontis]
MSEAADVLTRVEQRLRDDLQLSAADVDGVREVLDEEVAGLLHDREEWACDTCGENMQTATRYPVGDEPVSECNECIFGDPPDGKGERATLEDYESAGDDRAVYEPGDGRRLAVRVDDEWLPELMLYAGDLPVFIGDDGTEVDVRDDGTALYETPDGAAEELEPDRDADGVRTYTPLSVYPADTIEVHDLGESET